ncbi:MAG: response regulator [Chloroflexaceae bacterium]|nr:response regulator [Chloroflexaceae bacterium]
MSAPLGGTVLFADDDHELREVLAALLTQLGYEYIETTSGAQAIDAALQHLPDLIILDVLLPDRDGYSICRHIRNTPQLAEVPIILITATDTPEARLEGLQAGADDFLAKPIAMSELHLRIRNVLRLNRYRLLREERAKFTWMAEQNDVAYLILDADDYIVYANQVARRYIEQLPSPVSAAFPSQTFLEIVQQHYNCEPRDEWANWPHPAAHNAPRYLVLPETIRNRAFWLEVEVVPLSHRIPTSHLVRLRDVTSLMNLQHDMRGFQTLVMHKLRTPLVGVLGGLELLLNDPNVQQHPMIRDLLDLAMQSARRLHSDVTDVVSYLQSESVVDPYPGLVLHHLLGRVELIAENLGIGFIHFEMPDALSPLRISIPARMLDIIFYELLDNSIKFHPTRSPQITITVQRVEPQRIAITIMDDGLNLTPEQLTAAPNPYYQGEKTLTGEVPGMGLGLPTVTTLLWRNGGTVVVGNRPDGPGVTVTLFVPLVQVGAG